MKSKSQLLAIVVPILAASAIWFSVAKFQSDPPYKGTDAAYTSAQTPPETTPEIAVTGPENDPDLAQVNSSAAAVKTVAPNNVLKKISRPLHSAAEQTRVPDQKFTVQNERGVVITTRAGNRIDFPPGAFADANGNPVTGTVEVHVSEYLTMADFIKADLVTESNGRPLISGGMFHLRAEQEGMELQLTRGKSATLTVPVDVDDPEMQLFSGNAADGSMIDWAVDRSVGNEQNAVRAIRQMDTGTVSPIIEFLQGRNKPLCYSCTRTLHHCIEWPKKPMKRPGPYLVWISAWISPTGTVSHAQVRSGFDKEYDKAILEAVKRMDNWVPTGSSLFGGEEVLIPVVVLENGIRMALTVGSLEATEALYEEYQAILAEAPANFAADYRSSRFARFSFADAGIATPSSAAVSNVYKLTGLGWYNIDKFMKLPQRRQAELMIAATEPADPVENVRIIFTSIESMLSMNFKNGRHYSRYLPKDERVIVLGCIERFGETAFAISEVVLGEQKDPLVLQYEKMSVEEAAQRVAQMRKQLAS